MCGLAFVQGVGSTVLRGLGFWGLTECIGFRACVWVKDLGRKLRVTGFRVEGLGSRV